MRKRFIFVLTLMMVGLQPLLPWASVAKDLDPAAKQAGEDRWVPSLLFTAGFTIQHQDGDVSSRIYRDLSPTSVPLRESVDGDDLTFSPFVGGALELMSPALPIPTRPRIFLSGEILPTFASDRDLALEGDPGCIKGPDPKDDCALGEDGSRLLGDTIMESQVRGEGSKTSAEIDTLVFGANLGVSFPIQFRERQLRIKPSFAWITYEVDAKGIVVDADCEPDAFCVDVQSPFGFTIDGFLRETRLPASESRWFNGIGPALDIEMDAGRFGPLGASLVIGARVYAILGDRKMKFSATETYDDLAGQDTSTADYEVEVDPWMYRAHVGFRIQWLGYEP